MTDLTSCQARALGEIIAAFNKPMNMDREHLLTGYAGSGKTTLMRELSEVMADQHREVVVSAPTHKAVAVLSNKVPERIACITIHALLGLKPVASGAKTVLERQKAAKPITADIVVIDECSMLSVELMGWIRRLMPHVFVLYVGDPAQLPPVNETESLAFKVASRSHLDTIVRQAQGNPVLEAAHTIRRSQGGAADWAWCRDNRAGKAGVFVPPKAHAWMQQAFTSDRFKEDNDAFRYLCWTNEQVYRVNTTVRRWIYGGNTPTPFMPGERVLMRAPVIREGTILLATNEEAEVVEIEPSFYEHKFKERGHLDEWDAKIPSWRVKLQGRGDLGTVVHLARNSDDVTTVDGRLLREARENGARWGDRFKFQQSMARMQAIYAMTVHTSQGSTFQHAFVDIGDIRRQEKSNLLEMQQMLYVAATRPSQALILVGAGGR